MCFTVTETCHQLILIDWFYYLMNFVMLLYKRVPIIFYTSNTYFYTYWGVRTCMQACRSDGIAYTMSNRILKDVIGPSPSSMASPLPFPFDHKVDEYIILNHHLTGLQPRNRKDAHPSKALYLEPLFSAALRRMYPLITIFLVVACTLHVDVMLQGSAQ